MIEFALALFKALAALPGLIKTVQDFAAGVVLWYVGTMNRETAQEISDAAAFAARAQNADDRAQALNLWRRALSRPRITP